VTVKSLHEIDVLVQNQQFSAYNIPVRIYRLGEGGCTAVVCQVVCYMEVRPGLSGKKTRWHFSEQRWERSDGSGSV